MSQIWEYLTATNQAGDRLQEKLLKCCGFFFGAGRRASVAVLETCSIFKGSVGFLPESLFFCAWSERAHAAVVGVG